MLPINHDKLYGERALLKDDQPNMPRIEKDLLRIQTVNTTGNFKSTPCQMGDNLAGDKINASQNQILSGMRELLSEDELCQGMQEIKL